MPRERTMAGPKLSLRIKILSEYILSFESKIQKLIAADNDTNRLNSWRTAIIYFVFSPNNN